MGSSNYTIRSVNSDSSITLTTAATETINEQPMYKNATSHSIANSDFVRFMKTETVQTEDFSGSKIAMKVNDVEYTTNTKNSYLETHNGYERGHHDIEFWKHDSKYSFTAATEATESVTSKGGDSVSIGAELKFSLLFSNVDTPGVLMGFPNVATLLSPGQDTEFSSVQSNTTKTTSINVLESTNGGISITDDSSTTGVIWSNPIVSTQAQAIVDNPSITGWKKQANYARIITEVAHGFDTGDVIYIENHTNSGNDIAINTNEGYTIIKETSHSFFIPVPVTVSSTMTDPATTNGIVYQKILFRPFSLSGANYVFLKIPQLASISVSDKNINNVFAKLLLDSSPGSILFNTYISSDKVFDTVPLSELFFIDVEIVDPDGELFEFNNTDHSFSLEITTIKDIVKGTNVSSRTGQIDES